MRANCMNQEMHRDGSARVYAVDVRNVPRDNQKVVRCFEVILTIDTRQRAI